MAGRIPQRFIDDLLNRADIVEIVDARVPLRKAGREFTACCPFHNEKTPSFTVSPEKQFYHCFGCGAHGTALGFLMEYDHLEFVEAVEELARQVGVEVPREGGERRDRGPRRAEGEPDLYGVLALAARFFQLQLREHPDGKRAIEYLKGRGVSGEIARDFAIGYAPPVWDALLQQLGTDRTHLGLLAAAGLTVEKEGGRLYDRFRDRVIFPIRDRRGRVIAFGGRVLGDDKPKYLNSPETPVFHKGRELYGLFEASRALRKFERLLVVEGYMDVVALAQHGIRYAVATLGTATTADHLERLYRLTAEVVFCFDGDRAGRQAAWRALENTLPAMHGGRQARFLFLPEGEDPDTLVRKEGAEAFEARLGHALPLSEFLLTQLASQVEMVSLDGRARLVELARPLVARLPEGVLRDLLVTQLAERVRLDLATVRRSLGLVSAGRRDRPMPAGAAPLAAPSLAEKALALILAEPTLAALLPDPERYAELEIRGMALLARVLWLLREEPELRPAALLERLRGDPAAAHLGRLFGAVELGEGLEGELRGAVGALERLLLERRRQLLWERLGRGELGDAEKGELRDLDARLRNGGALHSP